jgi:hypothetical protein
MNVIDWPSEFGPISIPTTEPSRTLAAVLVADAAVYDPGVILLAGELLK